MYDVLYLDRARSCQVLAANLEREGAAKLARDQARRHKACRMFVSGSALVPRENAVLVVRAGERLV